MKDALEHLKRGTPCLSAMVLLSLLASCRNVLGLRSGSERHDMPTGAESPRTGLLQWGQEELDLGDVAVGSERLSQPVSLRNDGLGLAPLSMVEMLPAEVTLASTTCGSTLSPGATCTATYVFSPLRAGVLDHSLALSGGSALRLRARATIEVSLTIEGAGHVESDDGAFSCQSECDERVARPEIILRAIDDGDSFFGGWAGDCGGVDPCKLSLSAPRKAVARFMKPSTTVFGSATTSGINNAVTSLAWGSDGSTYAGGKEANQFVLRRVLADGSLAWEKSLPQYVRDRGYAPALRPTSEGVDALSISRLGDLKTYMLGLHRFSKTGEETTAFMRNWDSTEGALTGAAFPDAESLVVFGGNGPRFVLHWLSGSGELVRRAKTSVTPRENAYVRDVAMAAGGTLIAAGSTYGADEALAVVAKYSATGEELWLKVLGDGGYTLGQCTAVDGAGDVYVGGMYEGNGSILDGPSWLAKLSGATGDLLWQRVGQELPRVFWQCALEVTGSGEVLLAQAGFGPEGTARAYVLAVDALGNEIWRRSSSLGFAYTEGGLLPVPQVGAMAIAPNGSFAVGGLQLTTGARAWMKAFPR